MVILQVSRIETAYFSMFSSSQVSNLKWHNLDLFNIQMVYSTESNQLKITNQK